MKKIENKRALLTAFTLMVMFTVPSAHAGFLTNMIDVIGDFFEGLINLIIILSGLTGLYLLVIQGFWAMKNDEGQRTKADKWKSVGLGIVLVAIVTWIGIIYNDLGVDAAAGQNSAVMFQ